MYAYKSGQSLSTSAPVRVKPKFDYFEAAHSLNGRAMALEA
jgi:hypothetical protein